MTERQYAEHLGLTRGAVQRMRASGRLVLFADGSVDPEASDARRAETTDPAQQRAPLEAPDPEADLDDGAAQPHGDRGAMSYVNARAAHEVLKAQERRLRLQRLRGEVVDRARATALVYRLARTERDAWLAWPARIAAQMAADLGVPPHRMQTTLEGYVREHLGELAEIRPDLG